MSKVIGRIEVENRICSVENCGQQVIARNLCDKHYKQFSRSNVFLPYQKSEEILQKYKCGRCLMSFVISDNVRRGTEQFTCHDCRLPFWGVIMSSVYRVGIFPKHLPKD